jgi:asparagine N-glycosylation enzyme membrane subunit Stt3
VLTDWAAGQFVNTLADRPSTASRYPEAEGMAPFFMQTEEEVRAAPLRGSTVAAAVRYVALDPKTIGEYFGAHLNTIGLNPASFSVRARFVDGRGHTMEGPSLGPLYEHAFATRLIVADGNGLAHFRLVFESRQQSFLRLTYNPKGRQLLPLATTVISEEARQEALADLHAGHWAEGGTDAYFGHLVADVKIFEQVAGARLQGQAIPSSPVTLDWPLLVRSTGRTWHYRQSVSADAEGKFQLVVPYASEPAANGEVVCAGPAEISWGPAAASRIVLETIPEAAVEGGAVIKISAAPRAR